MAAAAEKAATCSEMALIDIDGFLFWPPRIGAAAVTPTLVTHDLDSANDLSGCIFQAPKTGTIAKIGFRTSTVTNAQDLKVSFQGVTASGKPDGVVAQFRVVGSIVQATWFETGLITDNGTDGGTKRAVTKGDFLAVVIEFASTVGDLHIRTTLTDNSVTKYPGVFRSTNGGSSWSFTTQRSMDLYVEYDDGSSEPINGLEPFLTYVAQSYDVNDSPDEYALRFSVPFKCRVSGLWMWVDGGVPGGTEMILYEGTSVKAMVNHFSEGGVTAGTHTVIFATPVELSIGTIYYAAYRPLSSTNVTVALKGINDAKHRNASPGKTAHYLATRTDQGAWSDDTKSLPSIGLVLDQLDDGVSGGGGGEASHVI